jgi:heme exporter protein A
MTLAEPHFTAAGAPSLRATALACRRGERILFTGLEFSLRPAEVVWLRGSNGRGKTSLLRLLAGLARPEDGEISWRGEPLPRARDLLGQQALYLAHANSLKDDLSAVESLAFMARLHGQQADREALLGALRRLGLASRCDAPVRTLSQGQRRRVALARLALAPAKPLWILDEPYDALDTDGCAVVDGLIAGHVHAGGSVVLTSHLALTLTDPLPREVMLEGRA